MASVWKHGTSKIATEGREGEEERRKYRWSIFQHISATIELSAEMNYDDIKKKNN